MRKIDKFRNRLEQEWLVPFCDARNYEPGGFDAGGVYKLSDSDARDFMQAVDMGLVEHVDGVFIAPRSSAKEQIFWSGLKSVTPRPLTLWLEPIITMAGLLRLNRDFGWHPSQLGLQSKTWQFDLVAYGELSSEECIVCEVKKSEREVDRLVEHMHMHLDSPRALDTELKGAERNAFRKAVALRDSTCTVFWVLGPNEYQYIFYVTRGKSGEVNLEETHIEALHSL